MIDEITEAVLAREEVARYIEGSHGQGDAQRANGSRPTSRSCARRSVTRIYRALKHPLYPILRKIERIPEHIERARTATRAGRVVYASNHKSHTDYLVELLVLDENGVRPPIIAAGINLFGGPLGLLHRHVTGAIPIRRNTKDPAYLITLKAYVAELLRKHDLFFYPEGGRSYSGEIKSPKTGLIHAALQAEHLEPDGRADRRRVRPGARRPRAGTAARQADAASVQPRARRDGAARGRIQVAGLRDIRQADQRRHRSVIPSRSVGLRAHRHGRDRATLQSAADRRRCQCDASVDYPPRSRIACRRRYRDAARQGRQPRREKRRAKRSTSGSSSSRRAASSSSNRAGSGSANETSCATTPAHSTISSHRRPVVPTDVRRFEGILLCAVPQRSAQASCVALRPEDQRELRQPLHRRRNDRDGDRPLRSDCRHRDFSSRSIISAKASARSRRQAPRRGNTSGSSTSSWRPASSGTSR